MIHREFKTVPLWCYLKWPKIKVGLITIMVITLVMHVVGKVITLKT